MRQCFLFFSVLSVLACTTLSVSAAPQPSKNLPDIVLEQCEAIADPFEQYDIVIKDAVEKLVALGAFNETDFRKVKIGFCGLRSLDGPVATTSCAKDTILLDHKYLSSKEALSLRTTLAHEMKHVFQHDVKKAQFGKRYCGSDQYATDTTQLEEEADMFSDQIASYLFVGRPIEIKNTCPTSVSLYLETDRQSVADAIEEGFTSIPAETTATLSKTATTRLARFYAQSDVYEGRQWFWRSENKTLLRSIENKKIKMRQVLMTTKPHGLGSFLIELRCPLPLAN